MRGNLCEATHKEEPDLHQRAKSIPSLECVRVSLSEDENDLVIASHPEFGFVCIRCGVWSRDDRHAVDNRNWTVCEPKRGYAPLRSLSTTKYANMGEPNEVSEIYSKASLCVSFHNVGRARPRKIIA